MEIVIRPIKNEDYIALNALRSMPGIFENIYGMPSENINRSREYVEKMDENVHSLVAVIIDKKTNKEIIIGNVTLVVSSILRRRHCASLGLYGFLIEGTKKMSCIRFGKYEDEYIMARILTEKNVLS